MQAFINRIEEMAALEKEYQRPEASLVILYGRRRVGKTTLIAEFIKDKKALYYLATEESEAQNQALFKNGVADFTGNSLLKNAVVTRWDDIFEAIVQAPSEARTVLVIDEFQYLGKSNPAFPSVFQRIWDTILKNKNIMVILCGSLISMMVSQTLAYDSPLYGRRTSQMRLTQIPFTHYHKFFGSKTRQQLIEFYSITGGIPKYIELFQDNADVYAAIEENVVSKTSFLYDEPNFLLQREVNEIGSYFSLIKTIALGNQKIGKIAGALGVKQSGLSKYLKTLVDLDILEREVPVTEENPAKSRRGLYKIKDNFMLFWFRFIYPNMSAIESGHPELAMTKIKSHLIDNHVAFVYEDVCLEEMWRLNAANAWPFAFTKAGRWWDNKNNEIDIVALDPEGNNIIFGECKYWKGPIGANVLHDLEAKTALVDWHRDNRTASYVLFSINGFTDELITLAAQRE
ncbi:MAG: DUF234 domain-containing protein, partial [Christensenella sp.]